MIQFFRKPLIIMTPKSLLRHKRAVSELEELERGKFQTVLDDTKDFQKAENLILCSGKVYYDLLEKRESLEKPNTAILRLEQIYPFPQERLKDILGKYENVKTLRWVQEEPRNKGGWSFVQERLNDLEQGRWIYTGRSASASSSAGSHKKNSEELEAFLNEAFIEVTHD